LFDPLVIERSLRRTTLRGVEASEAAMLAMLCDLVEGAFGELELLLPETVLGLDGEDCRAAPPVGLGSFGGFSFELRMKEGRKW